MIGNHEDKIVSDSTCSNVDILSLIVIDNHDKDNIFQTIENNTIKNHCNIIIIKERNASFVKAYALYINTIDIPHSVCFHVI
jgi:hypothetical protein